MNQVPVYKVGAVLLRVRAGAPEVLVVRPKPKNAGEVPQLVLPRGSRQYRNGEKWVDVRDAQTAATHAAALEPFERALAREVEEEAGLSARLLPQQKVIELGARDYASRTKGTYQVHWFAVVVSDDAQADMAKQMPVDATEARWVKVSELEALADFAVGYLPVIHEAVELIS